MKATTPRPVPDFCFDELATIAATDAEGFERLRAALIERVINMPGGNATALAALQNRLNQRGDPSTPGYVDCLRLSTWLDEPYRRLSQKLGDARSLACGGASPC